MKVALYLRAACLYPPFSFRIICLTSVQEHFPNKKWILLCAMWSSHEVLELWRFCQSLLREPFVCLLLILALFGFFLLSLRSLMELKTCWWEKESVQKKTWKDDLPFNPLCLRKGSVKLFLSSFFFTVFAFWSYLNTSSWNILFFIFFN